VPCAQAEADCLRVPKYGDGLSALAVQLARMGDFRKLRVWQASRVFAIDVRKITSRMRRSGIGKLDDQLLRSAMSIGDNIIEGNAHKSTKEFVRFLGYSLSSAWEAEGQLQRAIDFNLIKQSEFSLLQEQVIDIRRMLYGLIRKLNRPGGDEEVEDPPTSGDSPGTPDA
jgi:four helix bundle protein